MTSIAVDNGGPAAHIARTFDLVGGAQTLSASFMWGVTTRFLPRDGHLTSTQRPK